MSTYASIADLKVYVDGNGIQLPSDTHLQRILDRAERDVDSIAGPWPIIDTGTGRKFDPDTLAGYQAEALKNATCAQAEYRILQGETFMAKAQHQVVRIEDDEGAAEFRAGQLPYIGPKVARELSLGGLVRTTDMQLVDLGIGRTGVTPIIGNLD